MAAPDRSLLSALASTTDPVGVVSVYVDARPGSPPGRRPAWQLEAREALTRIGWRASSSRPADSLVQRRLREADVEGLLDPGAPGRGRAVFVPLSGGEPVRVQLLLPLPTLAAVGSWPVVRPLAAALDAGRPAGFVAVGRSEVRVVGWRLGQAAELARLQTDEDVAEWRELRGPAAGNPALGAESNPQGDLFARRLDLHRLRQITDTAPAIRELATAEEWADLVVAGDPRLVPALVGVLGPNGSPRVLAVDHEGGWQAPDDLVRALLPTVEEARAETLAAEVRRLADEASTGGRAALGAADVERALQDGQVRRLLLGATLAVPAPGGAPVVDGEDVAERLIRDGIRAGASVECCPAGVEHLLEPLGGVAAQLRW